MAFRKGRDFVIVMSTETMKIWIAFRTCFLADDSIAMDFYVAHLT
jgi:hypothetical protein